jgi:di/tricarboxylate transporter
MTAEIWMVLGILAVTIALFISDRLRVDVVALLVIVALVITGLVTPEAALSGFSSPAVITVWAVFIISGAMYQSGVADWLAETMLRLAGQNEMRLLLVIMVTVGVMSAFMNNIGAVAILLPAVVSIARQMNMSPSRLLMPLAFAALLGGNMTLIGTPPNILASAILQEYAGIEPFTFFDFLPMGLIVLAAGIIYMLFVGRRLLPDRSPDGELANAYPVREYLTEARVAEASPLIGRTISETRFGEKFDLTILHVRHSRELMGPFTEYHLEAGDVLLIEGSPEDILQASRQQGIRPLADWRSSDWHPEENPDALQLAEMTLAPNGRYADSTLKEINFGAKYGLTVLAIRHDGESLTTHLGDVRLQFGDSLLVQGATDKLNLIRRDPNFMMLDRPPIELRNRDKAPLAVAILAAVLITVTFGWLNVSITMLIGALLMVISGVLTMDEAYRSIDWKSVFLIAGMLPLGIAMEQTGTAQLLADQLVLLIGGLGPIVVMAGVFVLTALLTEVISNAAAAVLMVPIAIDAAFGLSVNPQPFVMATVIAASTSFLMPVGHQVNVIIMGPGGYKFSDYTRVGVWLNLILLLLVVTVLPLIWPLT